MHIEVKLGLGAKAEALHGEGRDTANTLLETEVSHVTQRVEKVWGRGCASFTL